MSLHTLAQHLQSAGRGQDSVLVHMTPGEVQGLQSLAMAHGGSLTINPETGLPEAGFLRSLLPMLAGAALTIGSGGALSPLMASMIVGGGTAVATGSLQQGLMAGLGAYGGAGLGQGLSAAGAAASQGVSAGTQAVNNLSSSFTATQPAAAAAGAGANVPVGLQAVTTGGGFTVPPTTATTAAPVTAAAKYPATMGGYVQSATGVEGLGSAAPASVVGPQAAQSVAGSISDRFAQAGRGFENITSDTDKFVDFLSEQKKPLIAAGIGTLGMYQPKVARPPEEAPYVYTPFDYVRPYNPSVRLPHETSERTYFRAAEGGLATLPIEQMSQQNAMLDNNRYPMAFQQTPTYASSSERPISQNLLYPATDADVTPYSGVPRMASGGVVALADGGTPGEKALATEQDWVSKNIKAFNPDSVAEPKGGFTNANVYATYTPLLTKERNELVNTQTRLKQYLDAKGNPKPGFEGVVEYLQNQLSGQVDDLMQAVNTAYNKIPRTDPNFDDPKKAATVTAAQTAEEAQINALLANFVNNVPVTPGVAGLAGSDFAKDIKAKLDAETAQKQEATIFQTNIAPVLAGVTGSPTPADSIKLNNAMIAAGLIDKQGNVTAKGNQYSGLAGFAADTLKAYQEGEKPFARAGATSFARAPTYLEGVTKPTDKVALPAGIVYAHQGFNTTVRNLTAADVTSVFEEVVGRKPTAAELQQYVGTKNSPQGFATAIYSAPLEHNIARTKPFTAEEIQAQAKYYWGREMDDGELAGFVKAANAGSYPTFTALRNTLTAYTDKTGKNAYQQNLQAQLDLALKPKPEGLSDAQIVEIYRSTLGRRPYESEYKSTKESKISEAELKKNLLNSLEYLETYVYKKDPTKIGAAEVGETGLVGQKPGEGGITTGTTTGGPTKVTEGATLGDTGLTGGTTTRPTAPPPPRVLTPEEIEAEKQRIGQFMKAYTTFTPSTKVAEPVLDERQQQAIAEAAGNIYRPQFIPTKELPDITFYKDPSGKSFAYRDPNKELGLTGLYSQMSEAMPRLRQGITFTPSQGAVLASPFSNVTPGLVTLQSAVAPQPYTPPTPVLPGTTTQQVALTPEEQLLMAQAQALQQNQPKTMAMGGYAGGGYNLGDYSDGGRLLKGPGDGVSDSIPASIGNRQPARLADGEFVIPARIVSELGNGSTDAGARQLYAMMDRIQKRRRNTVGKGRVAVDSKARSALPA